MRLGELLLASGLLSADQLEAALQGQRSSGMKLGEYLIKQGICRESDVVDAVCRQTGIERYTPSRFPLNLSLSDRLPADVAQRTNAVPLLIRGDVLVVAMMDPLDIDALDRIEIVTDREVEPVMCLRQEFTQLYAALYGHFNTMDGVMESFTALPDQPVASDDLLIASETPKDELGQPDEAPVVRLVNSILTQAVRESASDIHISPEKDSIQIRFRIDGKLRKTPSPPKSVGASIVSRIKILANMDISITRVPQDGRFTMMVDRREINVRVSTLPTIYGENVVMRLLDMSTNHVYTLDKLGMSDKDCKTISQTIERPYGMILSTGPTGSGKSTSLYSILQLLNKPDVNAITLEDPVEYRIDGIRQVQLNVRAGMTFASGLRSILRQDPDVIMVGEIRDSETAQIAVQAALTGHLVLSTLHTNDAPGAVSRLMEMHIEPYLVASVLLCSFAQRLVRKVCPHCAEPYDPPRALLGLFGIKDAEGATFRRGKGCYHCGNTGYLGRIGIFEVMPVTPEIQEAIVRRAHAQEISAIAQRQGVMNTLAQDAARMVGKPDGVADAVRHAGDAVFIELEPVEHDVGDAAARGGHVLRVRGEDLRAVRLQAVRHGKEQRVLFLRAGSGNAAHRRAGLLKKLQRCHILHLLTRKRVPMGLPATISYKSSGFSPLAMTISQPAPTAICAAKSLVAMPPVPRLEPLPPPRATMRSSTVSTVGISFASGFLRGSPS